MEQLWFLESSQEISCQGAHVFLKECEELIFHHHWYWCVLHRIIEPHFWNENSYGLCFCLASFISSQAGILHPSCRPASSFCGSVITRALSKQVPWRYTLALSQHVIRWATAYIQVHRTAQPTRSQLASDGSPYFILETQVSLSLPCRWLISFLFKDSLCSAFPLLLQFSSIIIIFFNSQLSTDLHSVYLLLTNTSLFQCLM